MKVLKIVAINLTVFIALLIFFEIGASVYLEYERYSKKKKNLVLDERATLSNYNNVSWNRAYYQEQPKSLAQYKSYIGWQRKPFVGKTINIDSTGTRITHYQNANSDSTIVFLGGSTMWGAGVPDDMTIPSYFGKLTESRYHIINLGETGYTNFQSYLSLKLKIVKQRIQPKVVITYDGVNNSPIKIGYFQNSRESQIQKLTYGADRIKNDPIFFHSTRKLFKEFRMKRPNRNRKSRVFSDERNNSAAKELLETWLLMKEDCDKLGAKFVCILQPHALIGSPNLDNLKDLELFQSQMITFKNGYHYYNDVIELINSPRYACLKPHFVDMTKIFDSVEDVYLDVAHVSYNGNEMVAREILNQLQ